VVDTSEEEFVRIPAGCRRDRGHGGVVGGVYLFIAITECYVEAFERSYLQLCRLIKQATTHNLDSFMIRYSLCSKL
jgi:hypothetical protein